MSGNYVSNQDDRQDENGTVCPEDELALLPYSTFTMNLLRLGRINFSQALT